MNNNKGTLCYVYLITDKSKNLVKIGSSNQPEKRLASLQTGNGGELVISGLIPGGLKLEREIQKTFKDKRVMNEWFENCEEIREFFDNYRWLERQK